jgi:glycosyltransferase involved in cell wall biosynthesis
MEPNGGRFRLAIVVSHPIQYYVPLYRRLAQRRDLDLHVFFTWHAGEREEFDRGFDKAFAWDIPLTTGYSFTSVPNVARDAGTHHFWGISNPTLVRDVANWSPDAIHVTGYSFASHLWLMRRFARAGLPVLFRGDSHLLDESRDGLRLRLKRILLSRVYTWPALFLYVGRANADYYRAFGVPEQRLAYCPHSIEVERFAEQDDRLNADAATWRAKLNIDARKIVLLFAAKFEHRKSPVELVRAIASHGSDQIVLIMVGDGQLRPEIETAARQNPARFRILPFQNQRQMPVVYRLADIFILPSKHGETWGLAVNESLACGRPALVSDKVGCASEVIRPGWNGDVFASGDWRDFDAKLAAMINVDWPSRRRDLQSDMAERFDVKVTEEALLSALRTIGRGMA